MPKRKEPAPQGNGPTLDGVLQEWRASSDGWDLSEEQVIEIFTAWHSIEWGVSRPGLPTPDFQAFLAAHLPAGPRRPKDPAVAEKTYNEWKLKQAGYTDKQILQELYPDSTRRADAEEALLASIRQRRTRSRYKGRH